jgi:hypothetical protein
MDTYPVIVCIAKLEHDYIEEFVKYHLALGFKQIFLYDNEDIPTYKTLLQSYKNVTVTHLPFNFYELGVQYTALEHFITNYLRDPITHVVHIDIDEYIVLKKHENISEFINEYIVGDCQGIGINWRVFGSSGHTEKTNEPILKRFTKCSQYGHVYIKTLFKRENFREYRCLHSVYLSRGTIQSTDGTIIKGAYNPQIHPSNFSEYYNPIIDISVIQLNHYKCKTLPEFKYIRTRGRAAVKNQAVENVEANFKKYDINEVEDLTAYKFAEKHALFS